MRVLRRAVHEREQRASRAAQAAPMALRALLPPAWRAAAQRCLAPGNPARSPPARLLLTADAGPRLRRVGTCRRGRPTQPGPFTQRAEPPAGRATAARGAASGPRGGMDLVGACRAYVERSNEHKVEDCLAMFVPDSVQPAVYGSTTVGGHEGIEAISGMMRGFFQKCPKVHWAVADGGYTLAADRPGAVKFDFVRTGVSDAEGRPTRQEGTEWVHFVEVGGEPKICRVEVEVKSTSVLE